MNPTDDKIGVLEESRRRQSENDKAQRSDLYFERDYIWFAEGPVNVVVGIQSHPMGPLGGWPHSTSTFFDAASCHPTGRRPAKGNSRVDDGDQKEQDKPGSSLRPHLTVKKKHKIWVQQIIYDDQ